MLDSATKKRIDDLRNILVGKLPAPTSQVEQITTGLVYKFMYDMDQEAIELGGNPSFFIGEFQKYSWDKLFEPRLNGEDKVSLYSEAIEKLYNNSNAPQFFRDVFKNSYLPFKDPVTLSMFLKVLNEFHYSHSEKLGDAFEYLLSFMGSQGDAGQFRTPRHIIDFIVEIINPKKDELILDPACGTAGFLISSYKHILNQNTNKTKGDKLSAQDKKLIGENLIGYDISPDMRRISLVNMYLHQFLNPKIYEYDTLSSDDRWNEYYDVILANPPFFSPKGGIQPHSRFGVKSTRAEVLFVDYIMEHLKPNGRAGIIVPEGMIFQTGNAYKTIRKKLVEDYLVGVISLPAGVFQPYSGVKTSILILDKELNQKSDSIFFAKVENDGFSLGAQRTPIAKNDLPNLVSIIQNQSKDELFTASKTTIIGNTSVSLSQSNYQTIDASVSDYPMIKIGDLFTTSSGGTPKAKEQKYYENGTIPWIRSGEVDGKLVLDSELKITELGLKESSAKLFPVNSVLVAMYGATAGKVGILGIEASTNQAVCAIFPNEKCLPKYLYHLLRSQEETLVGLSVGGAQPNISQTIIKEFEIPVPPIEVQQQIVDELEGYQKIIDGCRQVVENYKPTIDIDPSWGMKSIEDICDVGDGNHSSNYPKNSEMVDEGIPFIRGTNISDYTVTGKDLKFISQDKHMVLKKGHLKTGDILFTNRGEIGKLALVPEQFDNANLNSQIAWLRTKRDSIIPEFLMLVLATPQLQNEIENLSQGATLKQLTIRQLKQIKVCCPDIETQKILVDEWKQEQASISQVKRLMENYTSKIQERINKVWGK